MENRRAEVRPARRVSRVRHGWIAGLMVFAVLAVPLRAPAQNESDRDRYPLEPPDISSPEATLNTFFTEAVAAIEAYRAGDPQRMQAHADRLFQTLEIEPPESDADFLKATESSLYLLELLSRVDLPSPKRIPGPGLDADEMHRYWTIPHTELTLKRFDSDGGEPLGYRFSAETIQRLQEFYERARDLPAKKRFVKYQGAAERFRLRPGFSAPPLMQSVVQDLSPTWFETVGGEPRWKWLALSMAVLAAFVLVFLLYRLTLWLERQGGSSTIVRALVRPVLAIAVIGVIAFVRRVAVEWIRLTGIEREVVIGVLSVLTHVAAIWLLFLLAGRLADAVIRVRDMGAYALDAQLVRLVAKLVAVLLTLYALVHLAESLGVPVAPVLAGLGVGGLAVALAVRPTLENIIGGFVLFADAPVKVGEFCRFGDKLGTVEAIGLRSVRIRGIDRTVITIPNADFSQLELVNFTRRDAILLQTQIQLRYETTPDQLRLILARLRELLIKHPKVALDPARVRFVGYGDSSLDLEIFAYVETRDFNEFLAVQEDINLRIKETVEACGGSFAFPSRTLYVERSEGLDTELVQAAEDEVAEWRSENRLPFPDHDERVRRDLSGTLDYPPKGSSNN